MRFLLTAFIPACLAAQSLIEPPALIQLVRKPGIAQGLVRPYSDAGAALDVLGLTAVTGYPESWFVELHYNWTSIEETDKKLAAAGYRAVDPGLAVSGDDGLAPARTMIASFRPSWSYRADQAIRSLPRARYFQVTIYRIRAGTERDFGELIRLRRARQDSVNLDRPDLAYSVISGAPSGTYIFLSPIQSLRTMDDGVADIPVWAEGLADAASKQRSNVAPQAELSREHLLFRVEPKISYVSEGFTSADAAFWRGKN